LKVRYVTPPAVASITSAVRALPRERSQLRKSSSDTRAAVPTENSTARHAKATTPRFRSATMLAPSRLIESGFWNISSAAASRISAIVASNRSGAACVSKASLPSGAMLMTVSPRHDGLTPRLTSAGPMGVSTWPPTARPTHPPAIPARTTAATRQNRPRRSRANRSRSLRHVSGWKAGPIRARTARRSTASPPKVTCAPGRRCRASSLPLPPWRTIRDVIETSRRHFEELVADALDSIPPELTAYMDNVVITLAEDPPTPGLLGLYEGVPLTERGDSYGGVLPDQILIYWREILAICDTAEDVVEEVRITVIHEIAHHFGIDDDRLHELGWS